MLLRFELLGPFSSSLFPFFHCSGVGCVPEKERPLSFIIHHLSSPEGQSVNDGISREDFSLHYITIDHAIDAIMQYGRSAYLFNLTFGVLSALYLCGRKTGLC